MFCFISYFAITLDGVHLNRRATSAPDTDSASLLLLIIFVVATLCVNKDVYNKSTAILATLFLCAECQRGLAMRKVSVRLSVRLSM